MNTLSHIHKINVQLGRGSYVELQEGVVLPMVDMKKSPITYDIDT